MKQRLIRFIFSAVLFIMALILSGKFFYPALALFIVAYIIAGYDVVWDALRNIIRGKLFDENFLMSVATIGAFIIEEYAEAVAVMLFFQLGELFQTYAVNKSRKSIAALMDIRPDYANIMVDGEIKKVDPYDVAIGDIIIIQPGEKVPLDGIIKEGNAQLDTSALTGESLPREAVVNDTVLSGSINLNGILKVEVTSEFGESTVNKILDLVENAGNKKSNSENFITKFALVYTPIVVGCAVLLAVVPPFIFKMETFSFWLERALSFLVVSCPCALVISVPLSFFGGIGGASKAGILIKGSNYLEALAQSDTIVWDKTGTLTRGEFAVEEINAVEMSEDTLLEFTAHAESYSSHPISLSLKESYGKEIELERVKNYEEISGFGVSALVDDYAILVGNEKLMKERGIAYDKADAIGTICYIAINEKFAGSIVIADQIKKDSADAIKSLKKLVSKQVMLTGDVDTVGQKVGKELGLDEVYTQLLPTDKVARVEELLSKSSSKKKLVFVGDGMNDAPVLARADIGIAMGALGSDVAIEAADIVIMNDEPSKLVKAIEISKKTHGIAMQNIVFALVVKIGILILIAFGLANMWAAVFADVGVCVLAILNAMRALKS